jgi:hypothetical protein
MKLQDILEATKIQEGTDPQPQQDIVDKFAGVSDKLRSYYIMKWAEKKGMDTDDAMCLAGYIRDGYMGAGAWNWRYVGMDESVQEGEERTDIKDLMIPKIKEYLHSKGPGSYISLEDLESDLYDYARQLTHDDLKSSDDLRNFTSNPGDEASSAVGELLSGMYKAEFDDYITTEGRIEDTFGTKTIDKHDKPRKKGNRVDEFVPAIPVILTGLRLLGPIILRHATKDAIKKAVVGKVGGEAVKKAVKKAVTNSTKTVGPAAGKVAKEIGKKAVGGAKKVAPVVGKVGKEIGKKAVGPAVGGAVVVGGVSYLVDQVFDKIEEAIQFLSDLFGDLFDMETLKKIADMLVKYGLPIAGVLAVAYGGKVLVDYIRSEGDEPEEYDDELVKEVKNPDGHHHTSNEPFIDPDGPQDEGMIGQPDNFYDAEARKQAYNDLQDALEQSSSVEAEYVKDGSCPECPNVEDDEDCNGFGNYGCDDGILTYDGGDVSWKEIKDHDERQAQRQQAKANYPGDEAVIDFAASTAKQLKKSGQDPRDALEYVKNEYPSMGRAQRASLVAKGMKKAGLTSEGKSPHKKGSAKYKKHMAAMHAEDVNEMKTVKTAVGLFPTNNQGGPLSGEEYHVWTMQTDKNPPKERIISQRYQIYLQDFKDYVKTESIQAGDELMIETGMGEGVIAPVIHVVGENVLIAWDETADSLFEETEEVDEGEKHGNSKIYNKCWKGYSKVPGKSAGEKGSCKKNEDIEEASFDQDAFDKVFKNRNPKAIDDDCPDCNGNGWIPDEPEKECPKCDGEGKDDGYFGGTKAYEEIERMRHLAGLDEGDIEMYAKPDQVKKAVQDIIKNGFATSGKFINWCKDNNCTFTLDLKDPKNLQKIAIAKINFEKATGYGTDGEILNRKPPLQKELELTPGTPRQSEFDFESIEEAEYQGRKVKLGKPTRGDVKKFKVYVKDPKTGNVKKVNFGHGGSSAKKAGQKTMKIKKSNPARRKSFRARHNCDNPGPRTKARYWSCRAW